MLPPAFHPTFLYGLNPLPSEGELLQDGEADEILFRNLPVEEEAIRATPTRRPQSQSADGATVN